jgi:hypothetical protein
MHHTDIQSWRCQCASFNYSPYHICSHLLRLYGQSYPLKGEAIRQHKPPLLYIADYHDENQKFHRPSLPNNARQPDPPATLEQLGITQTDLATMECDFDESDPEPEESRTEEDMRKYEEFLKESERAIAYARAEMAHSRERFRRLPQPTARSFRQLMKLAKNASTLDTSRKRRTTWSSERVGGNRYRD